MEFLLGVYFTIVLIASCLFVGRNEERLMKGEGISWIVGGEFPFVIMCLLGSAFVLAGLVAFFK